MNLDLLTVGAFSLIALTLFILGRWLIGSRRNRPEDVVPQGRVRSPIFGPLTYALAGALPPFAETKTALLKELRRAGYYHRDALDEYLALRNALLMGWLILTGTAVVAAVEPGRDWTVQILVAGFVVAVILYSFPRLMLQAQAGSRLQRIQYSLPDALDMITMTMTGGVPLHQALGHVSREIGTTYPDLLLAPALLELRDFVKKENRPGGILTPEDVTIPPPSLTRPAGLPASSSAPTNTSTNEGSNRP
jgi:tight adherence protein C